MPEEIHTVSLEIVNRLDEAKSKLRKAEDVLAMVANGGLLAKHQLIDAARAYFRENQ